MEVILKVSDLVNNSCPYKGCRFNCGGLCGSETNLIKYKAVECDYHVSFKCVHYGYRSFDTCFRCGRKLNYDTATAINGEIDKICPSCSFATR